jgi:diacylglycerol kinase (ATP)
MGKLECMRLALVHNAQAGGDTDAEDIGALLRRHGAEVVDGDAAAERLVAAGGDGTLGPAAERAAAAGVPLAVLPTGTANDFARAVGIPLDVGEAAALAADPAAPDRPFELGSIDDRPFLNVASAGLAVPAAQRAGGLKSALGPLAYAVGAVLAAVGDEPVDCRLRVDGEDVFDGRAWQVVISVTGAFGGGAQVAEATPVDGLLDVLVVPAGSRLTLAPLALRLRRREPTGARRWRGAKVELEGPRTLNVDGELVDVGAVVAGCTPEAVRVVVPPES